MVKVIASKAALSLVAYRGDAKTLIAFDLTTEASRHGLAGFTVQVTPPGKEPYYLHNDLRFETPADHAQDPKEPAFSTINAPLHKFRWVHVPGSMHQGLKPSFGKYTYTVTPRYFDARHSMAPMDPSLSVSVEIEVAPFEKDKLALGFTRGFTQSQAFVRHFGLQALIRPRDADLQFDTSVVSGTNAQGEKFTYAQEYEWLGYTAREKILGLLADVLADKTLSVDVFAYDLNEPDIVGLLLKLGAAKRARVILDNAALHHSADGSKPEDQFERIFAEKAGANAIKRGKFKRYAHDKVFVVYKNGSAARVLTGSTNFSVTGLYVNSNHVLIFDTPAVAKVYGDVFSEVWDNDVHAAAFVNSDFSAKTFSFSQGAPKTEVTFSPHDQGTASKILEGIVARVHKEAQVANGMGNVLFAVMALDGGPENPVYDALKNLHADQSIFSFGISDNADGIALYPIGSSEGVLVTGKPINTQLPPPFNQVPSVGGLGHQIHHKFVVCGFNRPDAVVYCGSSNLALGGEQANGDNLLAIHDADIATVFAIEALSLVDHFNFLDRMAKGPKTKGEAIQPAVKQQGAVAAGWFLTTDDQWAHKFFDPHDLHFKDRELFAG